MAVESKYYIHDSDQAALQTLQAIPGFTSLLKMFLKEWNERQAKLRNLSSYIRIGDDQLPRYKEMLVPICEKLGIEVPELYLMLDVRPNAFTSGETDPFIVITSGLLDTMPEELIPTILAHECGHIACHHVLYRTMGGILIGGTAGSVASLPFGNLLTIPLQVAFFYWMRCSEYSADRAAVICDGTADKMIEVCMRLAGFNKNIQDTPSRKAFMAQAEEYRKITSDSKWDKTLEFYLLSGASHPFMAVRALECQEWADSEKFRKIMDGSYLEEEIPVTEPDVLRFADEKICPKCGRANRAEAVFCRDCGARLQEIETVCPDCGGMLEGDEVFCPMCGRKLK